MQDHSSDTLQIMVRGLPDLSLLINASEDVVIEVSDHGLEQIGWTRADVLGRSIESFVHPDDRINRSAVNDRLFDGETVQFDQRVRTRSGDWIEYNFSARLVEDRYFNVVGRPIAALAHAVSKLADLIKLADLTGDLFIVTDDTGTIQYANRAACDLHGYERLAGRKSNDLIDTSDDSYTQLFDAVVAGATEVHGRVVGLHADGARIDLGVRSIFDSISRRWYTVERDITAEVAREREVQRLNVDLRRRATTDSLTGVANRDAFNECIELALETDESFAVLLLDMDDFKSVNDTLGHGAGDNFLRCIARRLQANMSLQDMVARLGGDEFVVYLPYCGGVEAAAMAALIVDVVTEPFQVGGSTIVRSCSVGGAVREPGDDLSAILRRADQAAYRAKHAGRSRFAMYGAQLDATVDEHAQPTIADVGSLLNR